MSQTHNNPEELKAVLDRLAHVYSNCWSYEDKSTVKEIMPEKNGQERVIHHSFITAFDREARRLRYEFTSRSPQSKQDRDCVVWRNGGSVKIWTRLKSQIQTMEKVDMAIASAVGYSGEPVFLIPHLLTPMEIKGRGLLDLDDLCLVEKLDFNGTGFFKITGYYPSRSKLTFWVDITTSLILKVEVETATTQLFEGWSYAEIMNSGTVAAKTVITYSPAVNTPIEESKFDIKIPEE